MGTKLELNGAVPSADNISTATDLHNCYIYKEGDNYYALAGADFMEMSGVNSTTKDDNSLLYTDTHLSNWKEIKNYAVPNYHLMNNGTQQRVNARGVANIIQRTWGTNEGYHFNTNPGFASNNPIDFGFIGWSPVVLWNQYEKTDDFYYTYDSSGIKVYNSNYIGPPVKTWSWPTDGSRIVVATWESSLTLSRGNIQLTKSLEGTSGSAASTMVLYEYKSIATSSWQIQDTGRATYMQLTSSGSSSLDDYTVSVLNSCFKFGTSATNISGSGGSERSDYYAYYYWGDAARLDEYADSYIWSVNIPIPYIQMYYKSGTYTYYANFIHCNSWLDGLPTITKNSEQFTTITSTIYLAYISNWQQTESSAEYAWISERNPNYKIVNTNTLILTDGITKPFVLIQLKPGTETTIVPTPSNSLTVGSSSSGGGSSEGGGGNGSGCFELDTLVLMADFSTKPIQDIQTNDIVLSYNLRSNQIEPRKVVSPWRIKQNSGLIDLVFEDGTILQTTISHPFYTTDGWVAADPNRDHRHARYEDLLNTTVSIMHVGQLFYKFNSSTNTIETVALKEIKHRSAAEDHYVYNLDIDDLNTFFTAGILGHNAKIAQ